MCVNVKKQDSVSTVFESEIERLRQVYMCYFRATFLYKYTCMYGYLLIWYTAGFRTEDRGWQPDFSPPGLSSNIYLDCLALSS